MYCLAFYNVRMFVCTARESTLFICYHCMDICLLTMYECLPACTVCFMHYIYFDIACLLLVCLEVFFVLIFVCIFAYLFGCMYLSHDVKMQLEQGERP